TVSLSSTNGAFELNVGIPVMASNLLESIRLLANSSTVMAEKMIDGLAANEERARFLAEASPSIVTPLNKVIGYEAAAKIAKHAVANKMTVKEATVALGFVEDGSITEADLDKALDVTTMIGNYKQAARSSSLEGAAHRLWVGRPSCVVAVASRLWALRARWRHVCVAQSPVAPRLWSPHRGGMADSGESPRRGDHKRAYLVTTSASTQRRLTNRRLVSSPLNASSRRLAPALNVSSRRFPPRLEAAQA